MEKQHNSVFLNLTPSNVDDVVSSLEFLKSRRFETWVKFGNEASLRTKNEIRNIVRDNFKT